MRGHIRRETTGTKRSPPSKWLSHVSQTLSGVMNNFCYLSFFFDFLVKPEVPDFHGCVLGMTTQINFVTNLLTINKALGAKEKLQICDDWCDILLATCLFTMEQPKTDTGTRQRQKKNTLVFGESLWWPLYKQQQQFQILFSSIHMWPSVYIGLIPRNRAAKNPTWFHSNQCNVPLNEGNVFGMWRGGWQTLTGAWC